MGRRAPIKFLSRRTCQANLPGELAAVVDAGEGRRVSGRCDATVNVREHVYDSGNRPSSLFSRPDDIYNVVGPWLNLYCAAVQGLKSGSPDE